MKVKNQTDIWSLFQQKNKTKKLKGTLNGFLFLQLKIGGLNLSYIFVLKCTLFHNLYIKFILLSFKANIIKLKIIEK